MELSPIQAGRETPRRLPGTALLIVLYWVGQFGFLTLQRRMMAETAEDPIFLLPRGTMACFGIALSFAIGALHRRQAALGWGWRFATAILAALAGAVIHSVVNFGMFQLIMPEANMRDFSISAYVAATTGWWWTYAAISALLLTAAFSDELSERERRLAELQALSHAAQLRTLRYQLNPHFMFNTLNSVAALISAEEDVRAEHMVESLSDFLRAGLALDPSDDVTLERELALQSLYLSIEEERFADRLRVDTVMPPDLADLLVPSLILQPIVENAIKHGVARNQGPTAIEIRAEREGERLVLTVASDLGEPAAQAAAGTGVGLINVERRLRLRYGEASGFAAGAAGGRFVVRLSFPARRAKVAA